MYDDEADQIDHLIEFYTTAKDVKDLDDPLVT